MTTDRPRAAFIGFGEVNTPPEIIAAKCREARATLASLGIDVHAAAAAVGDDPDGREADRAAAEIKHADFDFLVACVAGWIPSWAIIRALDPFRDRPLLLWGLAGEKTGQRWLTTAAAAGTAAIRPTLADMGFRFKFVSSLLGEPAPGAAIAAFAAAARAAARLRGAVIGVAGCRDMRLYGTLYDPASLRGRLGVEVEHFELLEIERCMREIDEKEVAALAGALPRQWRFTRPARPETLQQAVRLCLALERKIDARGYRAFSWADVDGIKKFFGFAPAGALTLLHDRRRLCTVPENDVPGAVTALAAAEISGETAAYLEFYDFTRTGALMGVPDYVPAGLVEGPVIVTPTAFGSFGEGLLNVSRLKTGPVTLARLAGGPGGYRLHLAAGDAQAPPAWEEAGWAPPAPQLPGLAIDFGRDASQFISEVLSQHYIVTPGCRLDAWRDFAALLGIAVSGG